MPGQKKIVIALYNMGGPHSVEEVPQFLSTLFHDNDLLGVPFPGLLQNTIANAIVKKRAEEVKERYKMMGGASPQIPITRSLACAVEGTLTRLGLTQFSVVSVMRYTEPSIESLFSHMDNVEAEECWLLSQYPHCSRPTTGSFLRELGLNLSERSKKYVFRSFMPTAFLPSFADLWAKRIEEHWNALPSGKKHLIVSAHGVPLSYIAEGDPYAHQIAEFSRSVLRRLSLFEGRDWTLAWQSAVGPAKWLRPYVQDVIPELVKNKVEVISVWPVAFVSDHIETEVEIDDDFRLVAESCGVKSFSRVPNLNFDEDYVQFLVKLITNGVKVAQEPTHPLIRQIFPNPSQGCEGANSQPGKCLCLRYFQAGLGKMRRGL